MQELFAKEIPVAFAIDWKQSSDGNLSDAIQEKVESSGRNLPRFSCSSTASFLSQQGREESGHLQWFCMSVCLSKLIHDGEAAWESSLSEVKFVAFAGPVCSPISHRWVWSEWRASNSSLCHCYRSVSKGAANGHVLDTATSWVLDGAIFPWSTDHIYIYLYLFIGFVLWCCVLHETLVDEGWKRCSILGEGLEGAFIASPSVLAEVWSILIAPFPGLARH